MERLFAPVSVHFPLVSWNSLREFNLLHLVFLGRALSCQYLCATHISAVICLIRGDDLIIPCVGSVSDLPTCFDFHMPLGHT